MEIYRIYNKINGKSYIGKTKWNFKERYPQGKWWKWTHSTHLKKGVEKYGLENFETEILNTTITDEIELDKIEKLYIKQYNSKIPNGYNARDNDFVLNGKRHVNEYLLIDSFGNLYKVRNLSEFCQKNKLEYGAMLNMVSGFNKSSHGFALSTTPIENIINPNQEFELEKISTKEIFQVKRKDMVNFGEKHGIDSSCLWMIINKKIYVSHDFKLKETVIDGDKIRECGVKYKDLKLTNKKGEILIINNVYEYCNENNLDRSSLYKLIKGETLTWNGWFLYENKNNINEIRSKRSGIEVKVRKVISNEIKTIKNIRNFCQQNNLNCNVFYSMLRGDIQQYCGFCLPDTDLKDYKYPKKIIYIKMQNEESGQVIEAKNPNDIEREYKIANSASIRDLINNKYKACKNWKILRVKYLNDYYPEINNE